MPTCTLLCRTKDMMLMMRFLICCALVTLVACNQSPTSKATIMIPKPQIENPDDLNAKTVEAIFAGGCFWCIEGVFEQINGVHDAESGYAGGDSKTTTYEAVCTGATGHAEVVRLTYDPNKVSFATLLHIFFSAHDPTTLNRQGPDSGTQYRSAIFYKNDKQKAAAETYIKQLDEAKAFANPIVTTIENGDHYIPAEQYHQDFARLHPTHGYIMQQSIPKANKICKMFPDQLKEAVKEANK